MHLNLMSKFWPISKYIKSTQIDEKIDFGSIFEVENFDGDKVI